MAKAKGNATTNDKPHAFSHFNNSKLAFIKDITKATTKVIIATIMNIEIIFACFSVSFIFCKRC